MQKTATPPNQRLASILLGINVVAWVQEQRDDARTWGWIAEQIRQRTEGQVAVTGDAVRKWMPAQDVAA